MTMADDYVNRVLDRIPYAMPRRAQIGTELQSHIAERLAAGHAMNEVLHQLGDPIALAESYLAEEPLVPAPFGRRIGAKVIDVLLFLVGFVAVILSALVVGWRLEQPHLVWMMFMVGIITFSVLFVIYMIVSEWQYGQTIGKRLFALRVVRESGGRIGLGQSVVRQLPSLFQVFWIDALFALFTDKRQRAFELLSKTRVIDGAEWERGGSR